MENLRRQKTKIFVAGGLITTISKDCRWKAQKWKRYFQKDGWRMNVAKDNKSNKRAVACYEETRWDNIRSADDVTKDSSSSWPKNAARGRLSMVTFATKIIKIMNYNVNGEKQAARRRWIDTDTEKKHTASTTRGMDQNKAVDDDKKAKNGGWMKRRGSLRTLRGKIRR